MNEHEQEPQAAPESDRERQLLWIGGCLVLAVLVACFCILWAGVSALIYLDKAGFFEPTPVPTVGRAPEPVIVYPVEATVGREVTFDGSQSRAGTSPIASYEWDFGDGITSSEAIATHVYSATGVYSVSLVVVAEDGLSSTGGPVQITIKESAPATPEPTPTPTSHEPEPVLNIPTEAQVDEVVVFDGSQSQPGSSPIASYEWDFGDGSTGAGDVVTHTYGASGDYAVTLTVVGEDGLANTGGPAHIIIVEGETEAPEPTAPAGQLPQPALSFPSESVVGEQVTFDGSQSQPGSSPIASYEWDLGDGSTGAGAIITHTYSASGDYAVTLTVVGEDGLANTGGPAHIIIVEGETETP